MRVTSDVTYAQYFSKSIACYIQNIPNLSPSLSLSVSVLLCLCRRLGWPLSNVSALSLPLFLSQTLFSFVTALNASVL